MTLGHEFNHAIHNYSGLRYLWYKGNKSWHRSAAHSEYYAYRWSYRTALKFGWYNYANEYKKLMGCYPPY